MCRCLGLGALGLWRCSEQDCSAEVSPDSRGAGDAGQTEHPTSAGISRCRESITFCSKRRRAFAVASARPSSHCWLAGNRAEQKVARFRFFICWSFFSGMMPWSKLVSFESNFQTVTHDVCTRSGVHWWIIKERQTFQTLFASGLVLFGNRCFLDTSPSSLKISVVL